MRKIKRIFAVLLVLVMMTALTACEKGDVTGKWKLTNVVPADGKMGLAEVIVMLTDLGAEFTFEFKEGGALEIVMTAKTDTDVIAATWSGEKGKITMNLDGDITKAKYSIKKDKMTLNLEDSGTMEFEKAK